MSEQHTPEPWPSIERYSTNSARLNAADYERARICVNACAGISNEALERGPDSVFIYAADMTRDRDHLQAALSATVEHRDRLLHALHRSLPFVEDHEGDQCYKPGAVAKALRDIRAAIASIARPTETGDREMTNLLTEEEIKQISDDAFLSPNIMDFARAIESAILAKQREQSEPVAYGVFWRIDGNEVLQFPVCANEDEAKADLRMYSAGDQAAMTIRPLYAAPQPAPEGMVMVPREPTEAMIDAGWAVEELVTPLRMYRAMIDAAEQEAKP